MIAGPGGNTCPQMIAKRTGRAFQTIARSGFNMSPLQTHSRECLTLTPGPQRLTDTHDYLVSIEANGHYVRVFRITPDQQRHLYIELSLPDNPKEAWRFSEAARILGEDILMDSPCGKNLFA
jgi:hypothetical protein